MLNTKSKELLVEAREYLKLADTRQALADSSKWAAADLMWKANKQENTTQAEIAGMVGLSQGTVSLYVRMVDTYSEKEDRPPFTEAYHAIRNNAPMERETQALKRIAREKPEQIAAIVASQPRVARAVGNNPYAKQAITDNTSHEKLTPEERAKILGSSTIKKHPFAGSRTVVHDMSMAGVRLVNLAREISLYMKDHVSTADPEQLAMGKRALLKSLDQCDRIILEALVDVPDMENFVS